jgi:hypothetical protein
VSREYAITREGSQSDRLGSSSLSFLFCLLLGSFLLLNRISSLGNLKEKNPLLLVIIICWVRNFAIPLL